MPEQLRTIHIQYYAVLREQRGLATETLATAAADTRALYAELRAAHEFTLATERLLVAVNDEICGWDQPLKEGDKVVFIPPVAGG